MTREEQEIIRRLRERIDGLDRTILALLNDRSRCALEIGAVKRRLGLPIYDPGREAAIVGQAIDANGGPLRDDAVRRLFERILDESRRMERLAHEGAD